MKLAVCMTAYNRPGYLSVALESLRSNDLTGVQLFAVCEPGNDASAQLLRNVDFMESNVEVNRKRLHNPTNLWRVLNKASSQSDIMFVQEDDVVLSPDALNMVRWAFNNPPRGVELFGVNTLVAIELSIERSKDALWVTRCFMSLGWAMSSEMWFKIRHRWMNDCRGWDFSMQRILESDSRFAIASPRVSRCTHIGRLGGTHCTEAEHDRRFSRLPVSDGSNVNYHYE